MTEKLWDRQSIFIAAGILKWAQGEEYGVETLVIDEESRDEVTLYVVRHG